MRSSSRVLVPNRSVETARPPTRQQAQTESLCTSSPAQRVLTLSIALTSGKRGVRGARGVPPEGVGMGYGTLFCVIATRRRLAAAAGGVDNTGFAATPGPDSAAGSNCAPG